VSYSITPDSEELFSAIHDHAPFAISLRSVPDGKLVSVNEAFRRLFEFSREELIGKTPVEVGLSTFEGQRLLDEELKRHGAVRNLEVRRLTKHGDEHFVLLSVDRVRIRECDFLLTTAVDITEKKQAELAIEARRTGEHSREVRLLLESAAEGIAWLDAYGRIVIVNRAIEAMFGFSRGELVGVPFVRLVPSAGTDMHATHRAQHLARPRSSSSAAHSEAVGRRRDGSAFPVEFTLTGVVTSEGRRTIAFVTDMTERRNAAAALRDRTVELERRTFQLRQMASDLTLAEQHAREQLAKTLHDGLQQMLVVASIHLDQQLQRDSWRGAPDDLLVQTKKDVEEAIAASRSLSVELSPPLLKTLGLPAALAWLANWNREKYGVEVRLSASPLADPARRDIRTLLFESVRELLFNVVKHAQVKHVAVDLDLGPDDTLCITVTDEGIGFDPESLLARTTAGRGGLGLFGIQERLTLLGGRFDIESAPGQGTRFRLIAPRVRVRNPR
jgi:PAS domain S-box-containing protein